MSHVTITFHHLTSDDYVIYDESPNRLPKNQYHERPSE